MNAARACRRCRMAARSLAGGELVAFHVWGCDPTARPEPAAEHVVAALHLDGAALLEVPSGIVALDSPDDDDLWRRNMVAVRREVLPWEEGYVPGQVRMATFTTPPPADWQPLSTSPLWDDLDLYRDDVVDPHTGPRHAARRSAALAGRVWVRDAPGRVWAVLCETGRFLRAFPVLAGALAEKWAAEAAAIGDHEYVRGYEAGRRDEAAARGDEETKR